MFFADVVMTYFTTIQTDLICSFVKRTIATLRVARVLKWMVMRMTCKDCIHHCICKEHERLMLTIDNLYELMYEEGVDKSCKHFRNKADFVEVVRCEKCIYKDECLQKIDCECVYQELVFCSYGEREIDDGE